jgi:rhodanese-related sulfurtransferase
MTLIAAPVIGFAFGFFLERGGLGSARKLAGQFYFTDLTVFKVMFSALVTAMLGAFWLDRFGLIDLGVVYLPETFVWPQLLGGALFGAGFLIAGLCPGTSCVAAAAGRGDGFAVVVGLFVGVLMFNVGYEQLASFYNSGALGGVTLSDLIGTSRGVMVGAVTMAALGAFAIAERRQRVLPRLRGVAAVAAALGLTAAASDFRTVDQDDIAALDLATLIMTSDQPVYVFDLRPPSEFADAHIPSAKPATSESLGTATLPHDATIVLYSDGDTDAAQARTLLRSRGYRHAFVLRNAMAEWQVHVMTPRLPVDATERERAEFARAVNVSKFFGGDPREGVPRGATPLTSVGRRRRGC